MQQSASEIEVIIVDVAETEVERPKKNRKVTIAGNKSAIRYTVERFIDNHTLLPFYSPFCPRMRVEQVREDMGGNNPVGVHGRLGILAIPRPNQLRFCPLCAQEDKKQFGESYWHRLHQLPGVEVCPTHAVFLENSDAPASYQEKSYDLISAQQGI